MEVYFFNRFQKLKSAGEKVAKENVKKLRASKLDCQFV